MILVDTSVWIEILRGRVVVTGEDWLTLVTCGPVVQEVFQGLRPGPYNAVFQDSVLNMPRVADPLPLNTFLEAAELFRFCRAKGYTIRSSADCLIAAIAIANKLPLWHCDRDFEAIAKATALEIYNAS
jgi:predicted nucleic acid-binding protein